jgi:hypothetical protein
MNTLKFSTPLIVLAFAKIVLPDPLDTWTWRNPLPTGNTLYAITYGNGQFLAVGQLGTIATSTDGVNWMLHQSGVKSDLRGIAYGDDLFVAVGDSIVTSSDGVTWVQSKTSAGGNAVTFGDGQFVAVGLNSYVATSADGVNWVQRDPGTENLSYPLHLYAVGYGNGLLVAVGGGYNSATQEYESGLLTSTDGVSWTQHQLATQNTLSGVAYANDQFVVVGYYPVSGFPDTILTSADGVSWVQHVPGTQSGLNSIAYGNSESLAVSFSGDTLTSADGMTWVQRQSGTFKRRYLRGVAYGNGQFVGVGDSGLIVTTADGVTWIQRQGWTDDLSAIAYGNGQFVAVGGHVNNQSILGKALFSRPPTV